MNSPNFISSIDDCYKALVVKDYWEQPSTDTCKKIVKYLNEYLQNNPNDARAYYLRSMAKFQSSNYYKGDYDKDDAWRDYNSAIAIDSDVVSQNPDIRVIIVSHETALKYYFRQPVNTKVFNNIIGKTMTDFYHLIISIILVILGGFFVYGIFKYNFSIIHFFCFSFLLIILLFFLECFIGGCIKTISMKMVKKYCEEVVGATYDEWHG